MLLQVLNPPVVKEFIEVNEPIVRPKFPEKPRETNVGRKRCGFRWVLVILCIFARLENIVWRDLQGKLSLCTFLIEDGYLRYIPKKSKFNQVWLDIPKTSLESWIRQLGYDVAILYDDDAALDSSGFKTITGQVWRVLKWSKAKLKKTSKIFRKAHILITLPSRSISAITMSRSIDPDVKIAGKLFKQFSKRLVPNINKIRGDKAYWDEKVMGWCEQVGITPVIPPKAGSVDHGTNSPQDLIVRAKENYWGLYQHNHNTEWRSSVEHVFGLVKLKPLILHDRKQSTKDKAILSRFLWYNYANWLKHHRR